jgi:hypothetical protein
MQYSINQDDPYRIFTKGKFSGLINTDTKEIIIPAKYTYIEQYLGASQELGKNITYSHKDRFFVTYDYRKEQELQFLCDINGTVLYNFQKDEFPEIVFVHNKKIYLITKSSGFKHIDEYGFSEERVNMKLIRIYENKSTELFKSFMIKHLGSKNIISFSDNEKVGFYDLNTDKKIAFKYYDDYYSSVYIKRKNEIWLKTYNKEKRMSNPYYDTVIDSTLTIKPNPVMNALMPYENYFFTETKNGIQVTDYDGNTSPFAYPYLVPVKNRILNNNYHPNFYMLTDKLFVFSTQREGTVTGIIDVEGKIIIPERFTTTSIRRINYYTTPSQEFKTFFEDNKLTNFYYYAIKENNLEDEYAIFNQEGIEIINFRHPKNKDCSPDFDLLEKNRLQIKFNCTDSLKIYDLNTRQLIHSEAKKRY